MNECHHSSHRSTLDFINVYRSLPALWNAKNNEYRDRQAKKRAYAILLKCYRKYDPLADKRTLVQKINSLRTNFRKEWNKVQQSIRSGASADDVYQPKLWYYKDFLFIVDPEAETNRLDLCKQDSVKTDQENEDYIYDFIQEELQEYEQEVVIPPSRKRNVKSSSNSDENVYEYNVASYDVNNKVLDDHDYDTSQEILQNCEEESDIPSPKRSKNGNVEEDMYNLVTYHLYKNDDELYIMARAYAEKLRKMEPEQQLYADHLIHEVLLEGQLGNLNRKSSVILTQQCTSATQTQAIQDSAVFKEASCSEVNEPDIYKSLT